MITKTSFLFDFDFTCQCGCTPNARLHIHVLMQGKGLLWLRVVYLWSLIALTVTHCLNCIQTLDYEFASAITAKCVGLSYKNCDPFP